MLFQAQFFGVTAGERSKTCSPHAVFRTLGLEQVYAGLTAASLTVVNPPE
jgi:hypothetical protein